MKVSASTAVTFKVTSGRVPPGMKWKKSDTKTWVLTGKPKKAGTYRFAVRAKNAGGSTARQFVLKIKR